MDDDKLVLSSLEWALGSLENVLGFPLDDIVRDATIHRFARTYDLASRMIEHCLIRAGNIGNKGLTRKQLFSKAEKLGLIADADSWFAYHKARRLSPYAHDEKAAAVYEVARSFAGPARSLLSQLQERDG